MTRGLTCERAAERRARGLCPRHDVPAKRGEVLCAECLRKQWAGKTIAQRYGVSERALAEMARSLGVNAAGASCWSQIKGGVR